MNKTFYHNCLVYFGVHVITSKFWSIAVSDSRHPFEILCPFITLVIHSMVCGLTLRPSYSL